MGLQYWTNMSEVLGDKAMPLYMREHNYSASHVVYDGDSADELPRGETGRDRDEDV